MLSRIVRVVALAGLAFLAASCATTKASLGLDWNALEQQQKNSAPLALSPEIEMYNLRVTLLQIAKVTTTTSSNGMGMTTTTTHTEYPSAVYAASFGNGLCIDTENNIFLDVFSLANINKSGTFEIKFGTDRLSKTKDSYKAYNFAGISTDIADTATGVWLKGPVTQWGYTIEGGTYKYKAPIPLLANYDMDASTTKVKIVVHKLLPITQEATLQDDKVDVWGAYTVTKHGDMYSIQERKLFGGKTYTVYYAGSRVLFCEGDNVLSDVVLSPGQITVNGSQVVTYTTGG